MLTHDGGYLSVSAGDLVYATTAGRFVPCTVCSPGALVAGGWGEG